MNKIKVAIIGAGYMAAEHAKACLAFEAFQIVGICSRTPEKAHHLAAQCHTEVYTSIAHMYAETKADLVIVAVNELSMWEVCQQVFEFPWLCFLEKPVGYHYQQACAISELAFQKDHRPYVAFNRRSYSSTRTALNLLQEHNKGHRLVSVLDQQNIPEALAMGQPELVAANYMFANSIHLIDYFTLFCRGSVVAVETTIPWNEANPEYVVATIKYSSGDVGVYQSTWNGPGPWSVCVSNHDLRLEMRPLESLKLQKKGSRQVEEIALDPIDVTYKPGLHFQMAQLFEYFNQKKVQLATLEDSLTSMRLCAEIYQKGLMD